MVTYRIPGIIQYSYVEITEDTVPEDVALRFHELSQQFKSGEGVGIGKLAEIIIEYAQTGGIVNGGDYSFSEKENMLISAIKKQLRKDK